MKIKTDLMNNKTRSEINNSKVLLKAYKLIFILYFSLTSMNPIKIGDKKT